MLGSGFGQGIEQLFVIQDPKACLPRCCPDAGRQGIGCRQTPQLDRVRLVVVRGGAAKGYAPEAFWADVPRPEFVPHLFNRRCPSGSLKGRVKYFAKPRIGHEIPAHQLPIQPEPEISHLPPSVPVGEHDHQALAAGDRRPRDHIRRKTQLRVSQQRVPLRAAMSNDRLGRRADLRVGDEILPASLRVQLAGFHDVEQLEITPPVTWPNALALLVVRAAGAVGVSTKIFPPIVPGRVRRENLACDHLFEPIGLRG